MRKKDKLLRDINQLKIDYLRNKDIYSYFYYESLIQLYNDLYDGNMKLPYNKDFDEKYDNYTKYSYDVLVNNSKTLVNVSKDVLSELEKYIIDDENIKPNDKLNRNDLLSLIYDYYSSIGEKEYKYVKDLIKNDMIFYHLSDRYDGMCYDNPRYNKHYIICKKLTSLNSAIILTHELGHALSYNDMSRDEPYKGNLNFFMEVPSLYHELGFINFCKKNEICIEEAHYNFFNKTYDELIYLYTICKMDKYELSSNFSIDKLSKRELRSVLKEIHFEPIYNNFLEECSNDYFAFETVCYSLGCLFSIFLNYYKEYDKDEFNHLYNCVYNRYIEDTDIILPELVKNVDAKVLTKYLDRK